jgi:acyl carrier protein
MGSIFGTLCQGGTLVLPAPGAELAIASLGNLIAEHQITHFVWATVLYAHFLASAAPHQLASLRGVTIGGDVCSKALVEHHYALLPHVGLFNDYGPTEGTIWCSAHRCQPQSSHSSVPIGRPIANVQIYLLDAYLQPVPSGVPGELHIGGAGVARGYLKQPELTRERFIPDPFSHVTGARLYKTGDRARYLPDGAIEFLQRVDHQVKIRGFRIELDEVKEVLLKHCPEVREAVIMAREVAPGDQRVVGYLVPAPATRLVPGAIRKKLTAHLPDYMLPGAFVILEHLPLGPTGKIDFAALATLETTKREAEETFVAPTQIVQYQLLNIWEGLLETRPIGIRDNFFLLGGHSLLAARLVAHIEQVFGQKLELAALFEGPTIEQLAEILQKREQSQVSQPVIAVQTGGSRRPFFFLHGNWKGEAFYCFPLARAMGADQPFYALGTRDFGDEKTLPTIERIATAYVELLRSIQPEGPYLLGGYCNGGMLAYEAACQLQAQGQRVDLLALIAPEMAETDAFKGLSPLINGLGTLLHIGKNARGNFFLRVRHLVRHIYRSLFPSDIRLRDFQKLISIDARLQHAFPPVEALHKDYISILSWIVPDYQPGSYPGKITCFWPEEELFLKKAWYKATQASSSEDFVLPGTALTVIGEHIALLTERLSHCLSKTGQEGVDYQDLPAQVLVHGEDGALEKYNSSTHAPA